MKYFMYMGMCINIDSKWQARLSFVGMLDLLINSSHMIDEHQHVCGVITNIYVE